MLLKEGPGRVAPQEGLTLQVPAFVALETISRQIVDLENRVTNDMRLFYLDGVKTLFFYALFSDNRIMGGGI